MKDYSFSPSVIKQWVVALKDSKFKCVNSFKSFIGFLEEPTPMCLYVCEKEMIK